MKSAILFALAVGLPLWGGAAEDASTPTNVNARYIVEGINVSGWESRAITSSLSTSLRAELKQVVGANLDSIKLEKLAGRMREELRAAKVKVHVT